MGQAKRRGTFEERKALAVSNAQERKSEITRELNELRMAPASQRPKMKMRQATLLATLAAMSYRIK
jgi:hypothetical protein